MPPPSPDEYPFASPNACDRTSPNQPQHEVSSHPPPDSPLDYVEFPTEVLPEPVGGFIRETAKSLRVDQSFVALPLLSALAAAVGNTRRIQLKSDWCEPSVIWTLIIGQSGTGKSPAFTKALRPLQAQQDAAYQEYDREFPKYEIELLRHKAAVESWKIRKAFATEPPPEPPVPPPQRRYVASDATVEAVATLLKDNPRGLLVARDELGGWFASFDAYKKTAGADTAHWLSMFGALSLTVDRKTSERRVNHVPRAAVCITGGIQPSILTTVLHGRGTAAAGKEHVENGMAARFLMAYPPREPALWSDDIVDPTVLDATDGLFEHLLSLEFGQDGEGGSAPVDLPLTPEASELFVAFYNRLVIEQMTLPDDLSAVWSKLRGYAARFALLIHLVRDYSGQPPMVFHGSIDETSMDAGIRLAEWFGNEAVRVYRLLASGLLVAAKDKQEALVKYIGSRGGELTARALMNRGPAEYRQSVEVAERALQNLVRAELGSWHSVDPDGSGGRPTRVFRLRQCDTSA